MGKALASSSVTWTDRRDSSSVLASKSADRSPWRTPLIWGVCLVWDLLNVQRHFYGARRCPLVPPVHQERVLCDLKSLLQATVVVPCFIGPGW